MRELQDENAPLKTSRIEWLDILRGVALLAMASYHFLWDLGDFGYIDPAFPASGWPKIYARGIASTFLFLAGVSLVLAQGSSIRWRKFFVRFGKIVAAALVVSIGSYFFIPQGLIFFGILHAMAAASLIGLIFLRVPAPITVLVALAALAAPSYLRNEAFNQPWLWWIGLSTKVRTSFDYVPLLPWLCPFLLGLASAKSGLVQKLLRQNASVDSKPLSATRPLAFLGRHSLVFYLVHQPILIAFLYCVSLVFPAPVVEPPVLYMRSCAPNCKATQDAAFCARFCSCTLDRLVQEKLLVPFQSGAISGDNDDRISRIASECTSQSY